LSVHVDNADVGANINLAVMVSNNFLSEVL